MANVYDDIANEPYDDDFGGEHKGSGSGSVFYKYKVWNPDPKITYDNPDVPPEQRVSRTPGVVMATSRKAGGKWERSVEIVPTVRAVILYNSSGREVKVLEKGKPCIKCSSHDGIHPSMKIREPFCRDATADDIATLISGWSDMNQAKIEARVKEVTEGGKLSMCSIKTATGFIPLCPHAKKNPRTGAKAICKQHVTVKCWDVERQREFTMTLTGSSMDNGPKFISPFYEFYNFLRQHGKEVDGKKRGLPSFAFEVEMSSMTQGPYYLLNVKNYQPIVDAEVRGEMKRKAEAAREGYLKGSMYVPKEEYEKSRASAPAAPPVAPSAPPPVTIRTEPTAPSFDDDDIPF